jgi:hypothetical protein
MKIIGFAINKIYAEKKVSNKGKIEIKNNLSIDNISEDKAELFDKPLLKFDFSYSINYEPGFAEIKLSGSVIGIDDTNEGKIILKEWKDKKFNSEIKIGILNYIMNECILKALNLEKELGLPSHMPFPKIKKEAKNSTNPANYTG